MALAPMTLIRNVEASPKVQPEGSSQIGLRGGFADHSAVQVVVAAMSPTAVDVAAALSCCTPSETSGASAASGEITDKMMIDALKRKLVSMASELQSTKERALQTERTLEVERREHQLTTAKLSTLLKKRSAAAAAAAAAADEPPADLAALRTQIGALQQVNACGVQPRRSFLAPSAEARSAPRMKRAGG